MIGIFPFDTQIILMIQTSGMLILVLSVICTMQIFTMELGNFHHGIPITMVSLQNGQKIVPLLMYSIVIQMC